MFHVSCFMKILFTGGGTGGHLFPIIAIIREIKRLSDNKSIELHYIGPQDKTGKFLLSQENVVIHPIAAGKLRRYFALENITDVLFNIPLGFFQSFFILLFNRPDVIFSKGGSGSVVVTIAASILGIPVFLHESDMSPGLSNKVTSHFAKKIFTAFSKTEYFNPSKTLVVGQPILKELLEGDENAARELFHLTLEKPILLVWGGSQGAQPVNDFILNILNQLIQKYEIIHVCGRGNHQETDEQSKVILDTNLQKYYHLWEFLEEAPLKHALKVCHFVISRAGSGSIFEIAAAGKPAIIIPL